MKYYILILLFCSLPESILSKPKPKADSIYVNKSRRFLELYSKNMVIARFHIRLGPNPVGHKQKMGDGRTPEGLYKINHKNRDSGYHLSLQISYPNSVDRKNAKKQGISPGGHIIIHGSKNGWGAFGFLLQLKDWTQGCIAVKNSEIKIIWALVDIGTPIYIDK